MPDLSPSSRYARFAEGAAALHAAVPLVALGGLLGTSAMLGGRVGGALMVALAAGAWAAYLCERLASPPEDAVNCRSRSTWLVRHRTSCTGLVAALSVCAVGAAFHLSADVLMGGFAVGAVGLAYALPGRWRIKRLSRVKPFLIGAAWSAAVVALPLVGGEVLPAGAAFLLAGRALFYAANAMALDWPDRSGDAQMGLYTWAARMDRLGFRVFVTSVSFGAATCCLRAGVEAGLPLLGAVDALGPLLLSVGLCFRLPYGARGALALDLLAAWPIMTWWAQAAWG